MHPAFTAFCSVLALNYCHLLLPHPHATATAHLGMGARNARDGGTVLTEEDLALVLLLL